MLVLSGLESLCLYDSSVQMKLVIRGDWGIWKQIFVVSAQVLLKY